MNANDKKFHDQPLSDQHDKDARSERGDLPGQMMDPNDLDSKVNTDFDRKPNGKSLTNDESADTDPNQVPDKPGFKRSNL